MDIIINGYKLIKYIKSGNFGHVMKMEKDGEYFAVKQIKENPAPKTKERIELEREKLLPLNLSHENLIKFYGWFEENGKVYLVSEYFEGKNLKELIEENKYNNSIINQELIISILKQILSGLIYLHDKQISHRDIKPENILINSKNEIKIIDFGLSVYLSEGQGDLSGGTTKVGDKDYVPPEIIYKEVQKFDLKGDIFCLGYTIFELMYLERPTIVNKENLLRVNSKLYNKKNNYDEDLVELIQEMHKYYIDDRPSAKEAMDRLIIIEKKINNNINNNIIINNKNEEKRKKILSVMKCILFFFSQDEEIFQLLNKALILMELKLKEIANIKFTKKFKDILLNVIRFQKKEISDKDLDENIKDFIITYNNRQNNKMDMPLPLKVLYDILFIINREMISLNLNTESIFNPKFDGLLKMVKKDKIQKFIEEQKYKYKSPLIPYFYFLLIPLTKCSKCENVFKLFDPEIKFYLTLDNQKNDNILSDFVYNFFSPENMNKEVNCFGHHKGNYIKQQFFLTVFPKYLILEIKNSNEAIIINKILDMSSYTVSNEKFNNIYELSAIFYKNQDNNHAVLIKNYLTKKWISLSNNSLNYYDNISNVFYSTSLVIYKIKNN